MYIADLHIHSRYSRATSKDCTPEHLDLWARRKGIHIVGTGDFTHPAWREELKEKLEPAEEGLYTLKPEYRIEDELRKDSMVPRFVITGEISSIYKKGDRVRKVHSLILLPGLPAAELISKKLEAIGNIHSDGRPILGLDCKALLEIMLELCPQAMLVPAHIWTPHFSLFGAFSGFDTVEECFGDLSSHIHAMETGLSSDPPMNWRVSALDKYQLISNSDAHSPAKLGREANLMDIEMSYEGLQTAIQTGKGLYGTIEFFPEEGKYHFDGHRKCNLCLSPAQTEKFQGKCPVCGSKITIGVSHRVEQLADREEGYIRKEAKAFESLVPLPEVIGASLGRSAASTLVQKAYRNMLKSLGSEFDILRNIPLEEIRSKSEELISEGIGRLREGKVLKVPGFDGEYGTIRLFQSTELNNTEGQMDFFDMLGVCEMPAGEPKHRVSTEDQSLLPPEELDGRVTSLKKEQAEAISAGKEQLKDETENTAEREQTKDETGNVESVGLNPDQEYAVRSIAPRIAVIAGPGTGKTKTLAARILYLMENRRVRPSELTAVTFTNQAAFELQERVQKQLGKKRQIKNMQIGTFHAFCLSFLREHGLEFAIPDEGEQKEIAKEVIKACGLRCKERTFLQWVSGRKSGTESKDLPPEPEQQEAWEQAFYAYQNKLGENQFLDFDDLLLITLRIIEEKKANADWEKRFYYLLVDEFQDINPLQYRLIQAWNQAGRELFVIGDPNQSIYGFRGADAKCFVRLGEKYNDLQVIRLKDNYRSTPQILNAAQELLSDNPDMQSGLIPNQESGVPVRLAVAASEMGEAIFIAKEINRMAGGIGMLESDQISSGIHDRQIRGFDEIAVLYRTHRQAELLEKCLKKEGIPYIVAGRERFLLEDSVRASLAFYRYVSQPGNLLLKEKCGKLLQRIRRKQFTQDEIEKLLQKFAPLTGRQPKKFLELWMEEAGLKENGAMQKLLGMAVFYKTMPAFLAAVSLGVESDLKRCGDKHYTSGAVTLMTLHGAKGLEFPCTIIFGARKGMIPLERTGQTIDNQEERRLFYVGLTRAKEELILTSSGDASEFIQEFSGELIVPEEVYRKKEAGFQQMNLFDYEGMGR